MVIVCSSWCKTGVGVNCIVVYSQLLDKDCNCVCAFDSWIVLYCKIHKTI